MGETAKSRILAGRTHYSGERLAIRLRDLNASYRKEFAGLDWFPVDPKFRVEAKFTPHTEEKKVEMLNILGDIEVFEAAGYVDFELQAQKVHMEPMKAREGARRRAVAHFPRWDERQRVLSGGALPTHGTA